MRRCGDAAGGGVGFQAPADFDPFEGQWAWHPEAP
jgi:hypothetical protein